MGVRRSPFANERCAPRSAVGVSYWRRVVCLVVVWHIGLGLVDAQRIPTNSADAKLTTVFPWATAFSMHGGEPLHYKAYAVAPATPVAKPIGFVFWTTDLVPNERGYHGAIHILVGLDTAGVITGVVVDWNAEPYGHFSVDPAKFAAQFKGKSVRDRFAVGTDVDAVSGASITIQSATRAIRDSSRMMAKLFLSPSDVAR